jgi:Tfp pilus assembly major pilin PilA
VLNHRSRAFLSGVAGAFVVLAIAAIVVPQYGDYTARARASSVLWSLERIQERVSAQAQANHSLVGSGIGIAEPPGEYVSAVTVLPDGVIVAVGTHFGQVFVLVPSYSDGNVAWQCIAGSAKDVPTHCRVAI